VRAERERVLTEGLIAGFIGYATIIIVYGIVNVATGKSFFYTAALLGNAVLGGSALPADVSAPGPIIVYNGIHLIAFMCIGLGAAWLISKTELHPGIWYLAFYLFLTVFFVALVIVRIIAAPVIDELPWGWPVVWVNLAAAVLMGLYLWQAHPRLWREVSEHSDPEVSHGP